MASLTMGNKKKNYRSQKARENTIRITIYVILAIMCVIWVFPFIYLILQSLSAEFKVGAFWPENWTINNYVKLFTDPNYPFGVWFLNTFIIAIVTAVLQTVLVLMTAYALSRLRFKGRQGFMKLILIIGMFPGFLGMVVTYNILQLLGLSTSIYSLIILYVAGSAMSYYIAKGFFDTISKSLDEAVLIDGGTNNTVFWRIILPLSKPIVIYTILMSFTAPWGDYMMAAYLAQGNQNLMNVAVGLRQMISKEDMRTQFNTFCAGGVFVSVPILALFFWLQRYYVEGIAGGAVKG